MTRSPAARFATVWTPALSRRRDWRPITDCAARSPARLTTLNLRMQQLAAAERPVLPARLLEADHDVLGLQSQLAGLELRDDVGTDLFLDLHAATDREQNLDQREI